MENVEDVYELSPLQEGMLFHTLASPTPAMYRQRVSMTLEGPLDPSCLRRAFEDALARHPVLRSAFFWEESEKPLQVVFREVALPWEERDGGADDDPWEHALDLRRPPLMRLRLTRLGPEEHRLEWDHHHLLLDGWSFGLLVQEVFASYRALAAGQTPDLPPAGRFRDHVAWLQEQEGSRGEIFWRELLAGVTGPTRLGIERTAPPRGAGPPVRGEVHRALPEETARRAAALARARGVPLGVVLQAAWALVQSRLAGSPDVVFGLTVSGRPADRPDVERTLGLFINTLPVRARVHGDARGGTVIDALFAQQVAREPHVFESLASVQRWSEVPGGVPLFDALLVIESYPVDLDAAAALPGVTVRDLRYREHTNYPFTLVLFPGERLLAKVVFDPERYPRASVERVLGALERALAGLADAPDARLGELDLLDPAERERVEVALPPGRDALAAEGASSDAGRGALPDVSRLDALVTHWAAATPDARAVSHGAGAARVDLTYAQLERAAAALAARLTAAGVAAGDRVAVCLEPGPDLVVALVGVLRAGAAYVPLDPRLPRARLGFMLEDTGAGALVTRGGLAEDLGPTGAALEVLDLDVEGEETGLARAAVGDAAGAPDLAYVMYTSGSTGTPKGVMVGHDHVLRLLRETGPAFGFGPEDVWVLLHSFAFDFSVWELWGALAFGGRVVVAEPRQVRDPVALTALLTDEGVTVLDQTPSAFYPWMEVATRSGSDAAARLRWVIFGGEALDLRRLGPWFARFGDGTTRPGPRLVNMYGITETTVHASWRPLRADDAGAAESWVGPALPDLRFHVLDGELSPVGVGVPGELYVGGAGVARGYWRRPGLTAARFLPDPFGANRGARLYRTGDRVRWGEDGDLEFLGRCDQQVELRGHRVEPGEIEAALRAIEGVGDAVVVLAEDLAAGPTLVGYWVPDASGDAPADPTRIRAALAEALPAYMVPAFLVPLEAVPRTTNGKLDRRALPSPLADRAAETPRASATTAMERRVLEVWREVLGITEIGLHDNFFDLGGHSLLLMRVQSRVAADLGRSLPVADLFEHPTVRALARHLEAEGDPRPAEAAAAAGRERAAARQRRAGPRERRRQARQRADAPGDRGEV